MSRVVQEKHPFIILYSKKEDKYIVYNQNKEFEHGHTHVRTLKQAQYICDCVKKHKVPNKVNKYFIISLIRISTDKKYIEKLNLKLKAFNGSKGYRNTPQNSRK